MYSILNIKKIKYDLRLKIFRYIFLSQNFSPSSCITHCIKFELFLQMLPEGNRVLYSVIKWTCLMSSTQIKIAYLIFFLFSKNI